MKNEDELIKDAQDKIKDMEVSINNTGQLIKDAVQQPNLPVQQHDYDLRPRPLRIAPVRRQRAVCILFCLVD